MAVKKTSSSKTASSTKAQNASSRKTSGTASPVAKKASSGTPAAQKSSAKQAGTSKNTGRSSTTSKKSATSRTSTARQKKNGATLRKRSSSKGTQALFQKLQTSLGGLLTGPSSKGKRTAKRRGKNKKNAASRSPMIFAFLAGILMAGICFVGIQSIRTTEPPGKFTSGQLSPGENARGHSTPLVLPPIDEVERDNSPLEKNMEAALAIQQALAELQVATSTDRITHFTEQTKQANFAFLQAAVTAGIPSHHIRITQQEEREHRLGQYTFQKLSILGSADFPQTLANSLESWKTQATLFRTRPHTYAISIQGVTTHEVFVYTNPADFNRVFSSGGTPLPSYPTKRSPNAPASIVIVMDDLGASPKALDRLMRLNYPVTCAFWPDAAHTRKGAQSAHAAGLEILIHMPMEPIGYPRVKPGKNALLSTMSQEQIRALVQNAIHKVPHAVGLNNHMGSKFTQHKKQTRHVLNVLAHNDLFVLDSVTHGKTVFYDVAGAFPMPRYKRNVFLDADASPKAIMAALAKTERIAKLTGQAIAIGHPLPATLSALEQWQHTRDTSIRIVRLRDLPHNGL